MFFRIFHIKESVNLYHENSGFFQLILEVVWLRRLYERQKEICCKDFNNFNCGKLRNLVESAHCPWGTSIPAVLFLLQTCLEHRVSCRVSAVLVWEQGRLTISWSSTHQMPALCHQLGQPEHFSTLTNFP